MRRLLAWLVAVLWMTCRAIAASEPGILPVYIEDHHSGSFGWFASNICLTERHVLVDAHSDATAVDHSDAVREGLRRVASEAQRVERMGEWRKSGRIQDFNWIEPLMPVPVEQIVWLAGWKLTAKEKARLQFDASVSVDGRLEFEARAVGELGGRWQVVDAEGFERWDPGTLPVVASIDLDFFAEMQPDEARKRFHQIWTRLLHLPALRAVSFAISRGWLPDDAQAFRLLGIALEELRLVRGARISFEPFAPTADYDDSLQARWLAVKGGKAPVFDLASAPQELRAFLVIHASDYSVKCCPKRWAECIARFADEGDGWKVIMEGGQPSIDGVFRVGSDSLPALQTRSTQGRDATGRVRWWALRPAAAGYRLWTSSELGKDFTGHQTSAWIREERVLLAETRDGALAADKWRRELDTATGWGRVRIEAEVETPHGWFLTPTAEVRVFSGEGFHAGLSEQFHMPYAFGIGVVHCGDLDGPDTGWGNDCANFLIYAWRRMGRVLPWGSPAQLRTRLRTLSENATVGSRVPMNDEEIKTGLVIDFGRHVAALWEDREPKGVLDGNDLVVHHLGGFPELMTLGKLAAARPRFAVRTLPRDVVCTVAIGGDVVLSGDEKMGINHISSHTQAADLAVVNLEGVPVRDAVPINRRYKFVFPPERLAWLKNAGVEAVGMANNHAGDAGCDGVCEALRFFQKDGFRAFGAGRNTDEAARPCLIERKGVRLAFFAVSCVDALKAGQVGDHPQAGVAVLPNHALQIKRAIDAAKADGRTVIVFAHWGREYTKEIDDEQREWARWLVDCGADLVAGSHPHVVQPLELWRGRLVAYSLGNALFPAGLTRNDGGGWLTIGMNRDGEIVRIDFRER